MGSEGHFYFRLKCKVLKQEYSFEVVDRYRADKDFKLIVYVV